MKRIRTVVRSCCAVFLCTRDGKAEGTIILIERGKLRSHGNGGTQNRRWVQLFGCLSYLETGATPDDRSAPSTVPIPGEQADPLAGFAYSRKTDQVRPAARRRFRARSPRRSKYRDVDPSAYLRNAKTSSRLMETSRAFV